MSTFLRLLLLLLPAGAFAQTYYYIDNIVVSPPAPTTTDPITITVIGNLSSSNSFIVSASHSVVGTQVNIDIVASASGVGLPVQVPHNESFAIGTLPAGNYTIVIAGTGVLDGAPTPEHLFTVTGAGGSACDSVSIESVQWAPYSDTALIVHVFNNSTDIFDYPGFVLLDGVGDTLAVETVNFFGIASESWHVLSLHPGAVMPVGSFTGTLHLWSSFYTEFECAFPWTGDLCPPGPCSDVHPQVMTITPGLTATIDWTISTSSFVVVATGTFELAPFVTMDPDTVCLPPGAYILDVTSATAPDGSFQFNMGHASWSASTPGVTYTDDIFPDQQAFTLHGPCIDSTNSIGEMPSPGTLEVATLGDALMVSRTDAAPLGDVSLLGGDGRMIHRAAHSRSQALIATGELAPGVYLLRAGDEVRRVFLAH